MSEYNPLKNNPVIINQYISGKDSLFMVILIAMAMPKVPVSTLQNVS
jgi:hypothetical protein